MAPSQKLEISILAPNPGSKFLCSTHLSRSWNIEFWILWGRVFGPPNYTTITSPLKMCILITSHLGQLIQQWNHAIRFDTLWRFSICFRLSFRRFMSMMTNPDVCVIHVVVHTITIEFFNRQSVYSCAILQFRIVFANVHMLPIWHLHNIYNM